MLRATDADEDAVKLLLGDLCEADGFVELAPFASNVFSACEGGVFDTLRVYP